MSWGVFHEARSPPPPRARPVPRRRPGLREREVPQLPADDLEEVGRTTNSRNEPAGSTEAEAERATLEALETKVRECSSELNIPASQTVAQIQAQLDAWSPPNPLSPPQDPDQEREVGESHLHAGSGGGSLPDSRYNGGRTEVEW